MEFQYIFKRVEKKYLLNEEQYHAVLSGIKEYMIPDKYGESTICNIYFDTEDSRLIQISIDKPVYKEKLRLRSYGLPQSPDDTVFLEIKKKFKGTVYKRRISLPYYCAQEFLKTGNLPENLQGNIPREIQYMLQYWDIKPKVFLAYERRAYYCPQNPHLRITFDKNMRSRYDDVSFEQGDHGEPLLPENTYIMEIKIPNAAPLWLARLLSENNIFSRGFSKYGTVYTNQLAKGENNNV